MNKHLEGGLLIITSMLLFGFIGPFVRWANIPNPVFLFYSGLIGFIIIVGIVLLRKNKNGVWPKNYKWLLVLTTVFTASQVYTYFEAYKRTTFANAVLLHYTAPIFAAFFAYFFLKERIDKTTILSLVLSIFGVYLIFSQTGFLLTSAHTIGIILAFISGIFYGACIVCVKKLRMIFESLTIMTYQYGGFILWIPFIKMGEYLISQGAFILTVGYLLFASLLPTFLYLTGLKYIKGQHIGIISYTEVVAAVICGYIFFNEVPGVFTLIGGALILISGALVLRAESKRR